MCVCARPCFLSVVNGMNCLLCRKVIRPLHGLQVQNLYDAELTLLQQKIQCGLPEVYGVIVEKVCFFFGLVLFVDYTKCFCLRV